MWVSQQRWRRQRGRCFWRNEQHIFRASIAGVCGLRAARPRPTLLGMPVVPHHLRQRCCGAILPPLRCGAPESAAVAAPQRPSPRPHGERGGWGGEPRVRLQRVPRRRRARATIATRLTCRFYKLRSRRHGAFKPGPTLPQLLPCVRQRRHGLLHHRLHVDLRLRGGQPCSAGLLRRLLARRGDAVADVPAVPALFVSRDGSAVRPLPLSPPSPPCCRAPDTPRALSRLSRPRTVHQSALPVLREYDADSGGGAAADRGRRPVGMPTLRRDTSRTERADRAAACSTDAAPARVAWRCLLVFTYSLNQWEGPQLRWL